MITQDEIILKNIETITIKYLDKHRDAPLLPREVEPLSFIIGSLAVKTDVSEKFLGLVVRRLI